MDTLSPEAIEAEARSLAVAHRDGSSAGGTDPATQLSEAAGGNRASIEAARNRLARRIHTRVDDFDGTAALQLLNRTLATMPRSDPLDWRVRWGQRFRRP